MEVSGIEIQATYVGTFISGTGYIAIRAPGGTYIFIPATTATPIGFAAPGSATFTPGC
jgi:hypothetical protein